MLLNKLKPEQANTREFIKKGAIACILIGLMVVLFVFNKLNNSEASNVAKEYIKTSEEIKATLGEIERFGWTFSGKIEESQETGFADLSFELTGSKRQGNIQISLTRKGSGWQVDRYELK